MALKLCIRFNFFIFKNYGKVYAKRDKKGEARETTLHLPLSQGLVRENCSRQKLLACEGELPLSDTFAG